MGTDIWLHRFAALLVACTLFLIFVGGLVTTTGSGLAVPDWPLSFGQVFPEMKGGVFYEHGHRLVAAGVGLLTVALCVWLFRKERRSWVRRLGLSAVLLVLTQGILGGITVLFLLPLAVSIGHAALAQIFFCVTVSLAVFTSPRWMEATPGLKGSRAAGLRRWLPWMTAAVYVQILSGAVVRHTASGLAIPDFPLSYGRLFPPILTRQILIHYAHRIGALLLVLLVAWVIRQILLASREEKALRKGAIFLAAAISFQVLLGALTIWTSRSMIPTTLHVAGGALTLGISLYLTLWTYRLTQPGEDGISTSRVLTHAATERQV